MAKFILSTTTARRLHGLIQETGISESMQHLSEFQFTRVLYCRLIKPQTFADCVGNELPLGWEESYDGQVGLFYINHISRKCSLQLKA